MNSPQQIDCDRAHKQHGCGGGFVEYALDWHETWNSCSSESYPFIGGNWSQKNFVRSMLFVTLLQSLSYASIILIPICTIHHTPTITKGVCQAKNCTILPDSKILSVGDNRQHSGGADVDAYMLTMLNMGPVSITVDAHADFWTNYKSGIIMGAKCTWDQMDHGNKVAFNTNHLKEKIFTAKCYHNII